MQSEPEAATRDSAYAALEAAINAFTQYLGHDYVPVDAVLIIGVQWIDDDGDRIGGINIFPRNGSQPVYITTGLLEQAKAMIMYETETDPP